MAYLYDSISSRDLIVDLMDIYNAKAKEKRAAKVVTIEEAATLMQKHLNELQTVGVTLNDMQYLLNDDGKQVSDLLLNLLKSSLDPDSLLEQLKIVQNTLKDALDGVRSEKTNKYAITVNQDYTMSERRPVYEISIKNEGHIDFGPEDDIQLDKFFIFKTSPRPDADTFTYSIIADDDKILDSVLLQKYNPPVTVNGDCVIAWYREFDGKIYKGVNPPKRFFLSFGRFKATLISGTVDIVRLDDSTNVIHEFNDDFFK